MQTKLVPAVWFQRALDAGSARPIRKPAVLALLEHQLGGTRGTLPADEPAAERREPTDD